MPCRDCLGRREFLAMTGGAAVAALGACGDAGPTIPSPPHVVITVANFSGLATSGLLVVVHDAIAARRTGASTFDAYSMFCTHEGCKTFLSSPVGAAQQFSCPCHGSQFNADGSVKLGPADRSLAKLPTSYNSATDELTIN